MNIVDQLISNRRMALKYVGEDGFARNELVPLVSGDIYDLEVRKVDFDEQFMVLTVDNDDVDTLSYNMSDFSVLWVLPYEDDKNYSYVVHAYLANFDMINRSIDAEGINRPWIEVAERRADYAFTSEEASNKYVSALTGINLSEVSGLAYEEWIKIENNGRVWFIYFEEPVELDPKETRMYKI